MRVCDRERVGEGHTATASDPLIKRQVSEVPEIFPDGISRPIQIGRSRSPRDPSATVGDPNHLAWIACHVHKHG